MSAFAEFVLVAILIYLWESTLWFPLRGVVLRKRWKGNRWKVLSPGNLIATRELGMVAMLPFPPDAGLAPCQPPPLLVDESGRILMETTDNRLFPLDHTGWEDIRVEQHQLVVGVRKIRFSTPRCIDFLKREKARGSTPEAAAGKAMRLALSPSRARREWRRWSLVSRELKLLCPVLTLGFFAGLPLVYLNLGTLPTLAVAFWLWCVMVLTACHLRWLGKRVYPDAGPALKMDAALCLLVPFHAMRAMEIASVHAMGTTHPAALILSTGDVGNPWLGNFTRRVLHPLTGEEVFRPLLEKALETCGTTIHAFNTPPDRSNDPGASHYCPRCHSVYQAGAETCSDCQGMALRDFPA